MLTLGAYVHCCGKGRKEKYTPLTKEAVTALGEWLRKHDGDRSFVADPTVPLFGPGERTLRGVLPKGDAVAQPFPAGFTWPAILIQYSLGILPPGPVVPDNLRRLCDSQNSGKISIKSQERSVMKFLCIEGYSESRGPAL